MTSEEENIRRVAGKENPFEVPQGYFENLTRQVMDNLPDSQDKATAIRRRPTAWGVTRMWLYMAAMFVGAVFVIKVALYHTEPETAVVQDEELSYQEVQYIQGLVQNARLDDYSLYLYLTDTE